MPAGQLLYHRAESLYKTGEHIYPGNWGRLVLGRGPAHGSFYREYLLEKIRELEFPGKPSRLKASFAFVDREFAEGWKRSEKAPFEYLYVVRIPDLTCQVHCADMSWIGTMMQYRSFAGVEKCARHYWNGDEKDPKQREVLVSGPLEVIERLTPLPEDKHN